MPQATRQPTQPGPTSTYTDAGWIGRFAELWESLGPETKTAILDLLGPDWSWEGKRVLDFGCGAGRTLKHFHDEARRAEIWGVDIDAESIELLRDTVCPPLHVMRSEYSPPIELQTGSFDLIWAISVFTHLTNNSIPWLLELHRLLKPGGLAILTYMGRFTSELIANEEWDEDRVGMNVLGHNRSVSDGAPMVMISDWWMHQHWGRAFEVLDIAQVHNQSWPLLRKRDVELTIEELARPADDPREYAAVRHNLLQAHREIEAVQRQADEDLTAAENAARQALEERQRGCEQRLAEVDRAYTESLSWRLTQPLRTGAAYARRVRARRR
jgi:SAM-dependent methyltransferase